MFAHARPMSMNLATTPDRADDDATQPYHAAGADPMDRRRVIVVVGQGQLVTAIVLRGMGFQVDLAADIDEATRLMHSTHAAMLFVRISRSHLRSLRRPGIAQRAREGRTLVAMVDSEDDTPLPGFDATIAIDDIALPPRRPFAWAPARGELRSWDREGLERATGRSAWATAECLKFSPIRLASYLHLPGV